MPHASTSENASPEWDLVQQAAQGDEQAFECIMRTHNRRLYRTARSILKHDAEAEEVLQDAYLKAWTALASFRAEAQLGTWLVRIVANEALGRLRRNDENIVSLDDIMGSLDTQALETAGWNSPKTPEQEAMRVQLQRLLEQCIDALPDAFRTVFMLREVEGMSAEEVALALDVPAATVRTRFFRARQLLQSSLETQTQGALADVFAFDGARCDRIVAGVLARKTLLDA
jgi:RNA polymerase sigma-70 factor (ECF subfamily)